MKVIYKHADLLQAFETFIVQGCNAQGVMGSGVAKLLRDRDENIFSTYRRTYELQGGRLHLGQVIPVRSPPHVILNAITQAPFGREKGRVYVDYGAVRTAMRRINTIILAWEDAAVRRDAIAMPLIGAGLAQGRWSVLSEIIEEECVHVQPIVYLVDGRIPDGIDGHVVAG